MYSQTISPTVTSRTTNSHSVPSIFPQLIRAFAWHYSHFDLYIAFSSRFDHLAQTRGVEEQASVGANSVPEASPETDGRRIKTFGRHRLRSLSAWWMPFKLSFLVYFSRRPRHKSVYDSDAPGSPWPRFFLILLLLRVSESFLSDEFNGRHCCGVTICICLLRIEYNPSGMIYHSRIFYIFGANISKKIWVRLCTLQTKESCESRIMWVVQIRLSNILNLLGFVWESFAVGKLLNSLVLRVQYFIVLYMVCFYDNINIFRTINPSFLFVKFIYLRIVSIYTVQCEMYISHRKYDKSISFHHMLINCGDFFPSSRP